MDAHEVLIVGGGPAGSTCAWQLRRAGFDIAILDQAKFPRDKVCGGWITPQVVQELDLDLADYARQHTLQPITAFRTSRLGDPQLCTRYEHAISYGIRRCEFDHYLLQRSGATLYAGVPLAALESRDGGWMVNGHIKAKVVVGAGGHFCPVAMHLGARFNAEAIIAAQETEFQMTAAEAAACTIAAEIPELFFCPDMKGYGWCFRKGDFLNVGLGRMDRHALGDHVSRLLGYLKRVGKIGFDLRSPLRGHAYLLYGRSQREITADGLLLIGDAAGLASPQSGEGIRPAVESALLAAVVIAGAQGRYDRGHLARYQSLLAWRFGRAPRDLWTRCGQHLPAGITRALARLLFHRASFVRQVVLQRWFLQSDQAALRPEFIPTSLSPRDTSSVPSARSSGPRDVCTPAQ